MKLLVPSVPIRDEYRRGFPVFSRSREHVFDSKTHRRCTSLGMISGWTWPAARTVQMFRGSKSVLRWVNVNDGGGCPESAGAREAEHQRERTVHAAEEDRDQQLGERSARAEQSRRE